MKTIWEKKLAMVGCGLRGVAVVGKGPALPTSMARGRLLGLIGRIGTITPILLAFALTSCKPKVPQSLAGYIEGEFVYIASPQGGHLEKLSVARGDQVKKGAPLFTLEASPEQAARRQAEQTLQQSKASLADAKKGRRPTELASLQSQLAQAQAALKLTQEQLVRQEKLVKSGAGAAEDLDKARSQNDQNLNRVQQLVSDLETAQLGSREDLVRAAEAEVKGREAALAKATWELSEKQQNAPQEGEVFDTLFREGEWVPAGKPVVVLLPPPNMKLRTYVPQSQLGALHPGDAVQIRVDGSAEPLTGRITFISPEAEYTPPVIYSRESREKFVYLIEARFDDATAMKLHPGQPVDVSFPGSGSEPRLQTAQ